MKLLKPVVASLCLLGVASAPAFAISKPQSSKDAMTALQQRANQMQNTLDQNNAPVLDKDSSLSKDWTKRITVSGQINVDGFFSNRQPLGFNSGSSSEHNFSNIDLNDSELDVDAMINDWTHAHLALTGEEKNANLNTPRKNFSGLNDIEMDEAYVTIGNLAKAPVFGVAGRQYIPFGVYTRHSLVPSLTMLLEETQATAANIGFALPMGLYGHAYAFRGRNDAASGGRNVGNWGGNLGYAYTSNPNWGLKVDAGYLDNMSDVDQISNAMAVTGGGNGNTQSSQVDAFAGHANLRVGPFNLIGDYVSALTSFNAANLGYNGRGARPSAVDGTAAYNFKAFGGRKNNISLSYQQSWQSVSLAMPKNRWQATYGVGILKDTNLVFALVRDKHYDTDSGSVNGTAGTAGDDKTAYTGAVRLNVLF